MSDINRILVVSRMTDNCQEFLNHGILLAWKYHAELFVLHVTQNLRDQKECGLPSASTAAELTDIFVNSKAALDGIIRDVRMGGLSVKELVKDGDPAEEIVKAIHDYKIDILVLKVNKESACERILFNRINEELVRRKLCPIIFANELRISKKYRRAG